MDPFAKGKQRKKPVAFEDEDPDSVVDISQVEVYAVDVLPIRQPPVLIKQQFRSLFVQVNAHYYALEDICTKYGICSNTFVLSQSQIEQNSKD